MPACLTCGIVADRLGPVRTMILHDLLALGFAITALLPTWAAQIICQV